MTTAYVLIVLYVGSGFAVDFSDKLACEDAKQTIASVYGKTSAFVTATCLPAASLGGNRK